MTPNEIQDEKILRQEDLKRFWPGFIEFRSTHPSLEKRVVKKIGQGYLKVNKAETDQEHLVLATETMMLFLYGAKLGKDLKPALTKDIPVPNFYIRPTEAPFVLFHSYKNKQKVLRTWFEADINSITNPTNFYTFHVKPWVDETDKTVSEILPDWAVVWIIVGGVEEFAHEVFMKVKKTETLTKVLTKDQKVETEFQLAAIALGFEIADVIYHSKDVERRALVWKHHTMEKYFPNWVGPTRELTNKVSRLRLSS